jgi:hypothetical protein
MRHRASSDQQRDVKHGTVGSLIDLRHSTRTFGRPPIGIDGRVQPHAQRVACAVSRSRMAGARGASPLGADAAPIRPATSVSSIIDSDRQSVGLVDRSPK